MNCELAIPCSSDVLLVWLCPSSKAPKTLKENTFLNIGWDFTCTREQRPSSHTLHNPNPAPLCPVKPLNASWDHAPDARVCVPRSLAPPPRSP